MVQRHQFRKGFLKLQRLGPVKFVEQSRWALRAPESKGTWAFPFPHFDMFYAYHKYRDLGPKPFRTSLPDDSQWYVRENDEPLPAGSPLIRKEEETFFGTQIVVYWLNEQGIEEPVYVRGDFWTAQEKWIEEVGKKILPMREFWYKGDLYTHFNHDGTVGSWTMNALSEGNNWTLMSTEKLSRILTRPSSLASFEGNYDGSGKHRSINFSKDHLEVFIPRGRGIIRDKL